MICRAKPSHAILCHAMLFNDMIRVVKHDTTRGLVKHAVITRDACCMHRSRTYACPLIHTHLHLNAHNTLTQCLQERMSLVLTNSHMRHETTNSSIITIGMGMASVTAHVTCMVTVQSQPNIVSECCRHACVRAPCARMRRHAPCAYFGPMPVPTHTGMHPQVCLHRCPLTRAFTEVWQIWRRP